MGAVLMNYYLGEYYQYPNDNKRFKLIATDGFIFQFECGHWCTENVFMDLIRIKTRVQVYEDRQLQLF